MNVLITGGTSGMGLATSKLFLEKGHTVLIADINEDRGDKIIKQLKMISDKVYFFKVNLADVQEVKKMYDYSSHEIGFMNCVVNNAGIFVGGMLHEVSESDWNRIFDVDVKSIFATSKYYIPDMIKNGGGTIVNTASVSGLCGDYNMAAYNAAKGAVVNLVRAMALDYGKYNIRVNNVCPSACATPMFLSNPPEVIAQFKASNPLKRICTPEEVAKAIYFLATDESTSCNGVNLEISGGLNLHTGQPVQ